VDARVKPGHDGPGLSDALHLRAYRPADEDAAIALWLDTWQHAYPAIDFAARVPWWRERWRGELVPKARSSSPKRRARWSVLSPSTRQVISTSWWSRRPLGFRYRDKIAR